MSKNVSWIEPTAVSSAVLFCLCQGSFKVLPGPLFCGPYCLFCEFFRELAISLTNFLCWLSSTYKNTKLQLSSGGINPALDSQRQVGLYEFKASLVDTVSSRMLHKETLSQKQTQTSKQTNKQKTKSDHSSEFLYPV